MGGDARGALLAGLLLAGLLMPRSLHAQSSACLGLETPTSDQARRLVLELDNWATHELLTEAAKIVRAPSSPPLPPCRALF